MSFGGRLCGRHRDSNRKHDRNMQNIRIENHNDYIRALVTSGLSIIPIHEGGKEPAHWLGKTEPFIKSRATTEQIADWVRRGVKSWALFSGKVSSNIATLDFDEKWQPGMFDAYCAKLSPEQKKAVDRCVRNKTRNNGTHIVCRTDTPQKSVDLAKGLRLSKNKIPSRDPDATEEVQTLIETRGEGNYALIPPSQGYETLQGNLMEIPNIGDDMWEQLCDIARTFNEFVEEPETEYEYKESDSSNADLPGHRFNELANWSDILCPYGWTEVYPNGWARPGKGRDDGISATTNYKDRNILFVFSTNAHPFRGKHGDKNGTGYTKFHAFTLLNHHMDFRAAARAASEMYPQKNKAKSENGLLEEMITRKDVTLFHDELGEAYISLDISDHQETWSCKSKAMKRLLSSKSWEKHKKPLGSEALKSMIAVLEGRACFEGPLVRLHNRVAWRNDELWYDLTDEEWRAIKIDANGWETVDKPPIIFKRYKHHQSQVAPIHSGDVKLFLNYINIINPEHRLLLLVFLITCFIPDFPHVMLVVFGAQGSSKSTLFKLNRLVIDPSTIDVVALPDNQKELVQTLAHHHSLFFDNVSYVPEESSDTFCRAITGSGFSKRELYENDEDIIYKFQRCIGINGINLVTIRPDLLERSLLIELERIDQTKRKTEKELYKDFTVDLPSIIGGIFDVLVKAIKIKPTITIKSLPRMADFAQWGCAIAQALGYTNEDFLMAYQHNIYRQTEMLVNENIVATVMFSFMEDKDDWKDTPTQLLKLLTDKAEFAGIDTRREKFWPKGANILSRRLNELSTPLKQMGLSVIINTSGTERFVHIQKMPKDIHAKVDSVTIYDTDDISPL